MSPDISVNAKHINSAEGPSLKDDALQAFASNKILLPVNMLDPIWKSFSYGQLWPLWPACSQNCARSYMPDLTSHNQLQKRPRSHCAKLIWIQSGWPGQVLGKHLVWKQASVQKSPGLVLAECNQLAICRYQTQLHSSTDSLDQPGSNLVLVGFVRFWSNGSGLDASRCARIIRSTSGQRF